MEFSPLACLPLPFIHSYFSVPGPVVGSWDTTLKESPQAVTNAGVPKGKHNGPTSCIWNPVREMSIIRIGLSSAIPNSLQI